MWPAIFVPACKNVITELAEECAYSDVHEILLLLFREFFTGHAPKLIDPDEKEDTFHIGELAETLREEGFGIEPSLFKIFHKPQTKPLGVKVRN